MIKIEDQILPTISLVSGNEPVELYPMQEFLLPHLDMFKVFYWFTFWGILFYLLFKFIIIPAFKKDTEKS